MIFWSKLIFLSNWYFRQIDIFVKIDIFIKIDIFVKIDNSVKIVFLTISSTVFDDFINYRQLYQLLIFSSTIWSKYQMSVPVNCNFAHCHICHCHLYLHHHLDDQVHIGWVSRKIASLQLLCRSLGNLFSGKKKHLRK